MDDAVFSMCYITRHASDYRLGEVQNPCLGGHPRACPQRRCLRCPELCPRGRGAAQPRLPARLGWPAAAAPRVAHTVVLRRGASDRRLLWAVWHGGHARGR
eukprot:2981665-Prymnesium_polylepis.1